jgi:hypothetical protein
MTTDLPANDDAFYEQAYQELQSDQPDIATWSKALAESGGNKAQAKSAYIRLRVQALQAEFSNVNRPPVQHQPAISKDLSTAISQKQKHYKWPIIGLVLTTLIGLAVYLSGDQSNTETSQQTLSDKYELLADGAYVKDKKTGLVWMRCSLGQTWDGNTCVGEVKKFTFDEAQAAVEHLNTKSFDDIKAWRLPTVRELQGLRVCSKGFEGEQKDLDDDGPSVSFMCKDGNESDSARPTIDIIAFPSTSPDSYWTSSVNDTIMWDVTFYGGLVSWLPRDLKAHVRLVRSDANFPTGKLNSNKPIAIGVVHGLNPKGDGFLAMRKSPDSNSEMLFKLQEGEAVEIYEEKDGWVYVKTKDGDKFGWSSKQWVRTHEAQPASELSETATSEQVALETIEYISLCAYGSRGRCTYTPQVAEFTMRCKAYFEPEITMPLEEKLKYCHPAAQDDGNADPQFAVARLYQMGAGPGSAENGDKQAAMWYFKAAERGHAEAQNNLAVMYYYGQGVDKNIPLAVEWLEKSAAQGNQVAQQSLGKIKTGGTAKAKPVTETAESKPASQERFIAQGDTVKDTETGLVWKRCSEGQTWDGNTCIGETIKTDIEHAKNLVTKGWRLPTVRELASLRICSTGFNNSMLEDIQDGGAHVAKLCNDGSTKPAIAAVFINATSHWYLSSSPDTSDSTQAWFVRFSNGLVYKLDSYNKYMEVRLVRSAY